jgi:hypothetical protein
MLYSGRKSEPAGWAMAENLPRDGLAAVVKRDCPTCVMAAWVGLDLGLVEDVAGILPGMLRFRQKDAAAIVEMKRRPPFDSISTFNQ